MASCSWGLFLAAACLTAAPAAPRADEAAAPKRLALVLFEKGSPDRGLVDGFLAALADIDGRAGSVSIVAGRELDKRLGRAHAEAVGACRKDLRCVAAVGGNAGATHVLLGRATAQADGVSVQWLLVSVRTAGIVGKLLLELTTPSSVEPAAARVARELLGVAEADIARPPPPVAVAPVTTAPAPAPVQQEQERRSYWTGPRIVADAAVVGGLLALGAAVYFGNRAADPGRDVAYAPRSTGLGMALAPERSRADRNRSAVLYAAGGLLAASGVAVWAHDRLAIAPAISVEADARMAGVTVAW